jgi:hypothetical protein
MGKDMSSVDAPFGFVPYGQVLRVQRYAVNTAPTINIAVGDLLTAGGAVVSTPKGYLMDVDDAAVMDGTAAILGAVVAVEDEDGLPLSYMAATRTGNGTIAGYVMIADHPDQLFLAQEDGETNAIDLAEGSQNADAISASLAAPDTNTGRSTMEIDSDTAGTSADLNVKLIAPHPDDTPADDTNHYCRWICQINEHYYGDTIAGV